MKQMLIVLCVIVAAGIVLNVGIGAQPPSQTSSFKYPAPNGSYHVGRTAYYWIDDNREETFTDEPNDRRQVAVTVWYPAAETDATGSSWIVPELAQSYEAQTGAPIGLLMSGIQVNARTGVDLAESDTPFPVLVMSHGSGLLPELYTTTAEALASHGFVVFGVSHPYNALAALLADGQVVLASPAADPVNIEVAPGASAVDIAELTDERGTSLLEVQADDLRFVLDQVERLNGSDTRFMGRLDVEHVGVFGHSFGGATSVVALLADSRFDAAAIIDGSLFADVPDAVDHPILGIFADETLALAAPTEADIAALGLRPEEIERVTRTMGRMTDLFARAQPGYLVQIADTKHMNFSDAGLLADVLPGLTEQLGMIEPAYSLEITNAYLLTFFDETLRNAPSALANLPDQYPQSTIVSGS
jgi:predicted dienelactone hydrolase